MSGASRDETGKILGHWLVLGREPNDRFGGSMWKVQCDCEDKTIKIVTGNSLRSGKSVSCGCIKHIGKPIKSGSRFGKWEVLRRAADLSYNSRASRAYLCKCTCGREVVVSASHLRCGNTSSCRSCRKSKHCFAMNEAAKRRVLHLYKGGARHRGIVWNLSEDEFYGFMVQHCHYCGCAPNNVSRPGPREATQEELFVYMGIDRVDSFIGYEFFNCVPCCLMCNRAKADSPVEEFIRWVARVHKHLSEVQNLNEHRGPMEIAMAGWDGH